MLAMIKALHLTTLSCWKDLVSRLGIEPRTSKLTVYCFDRPGSALAPDRIVVTNITHLDRSFAIKVLPAGLIAHGVGGRLRALWRAICGLSLIDRQVRDGSHRGSDPVQSQPTNRVRAGRQQR